MIAFCIKRIFLLLSLWCPAQLFSQVVKDNEVLVEHVNPLVGSDSKMILSNGNTYPAIAMPWGMNFWTSQTGKSGDCFIYQYNVDKIRGFK